jgi:hypothetical protein
MLCAECGVEADEKAAGWCAYLGQDPDEDPSRIAFVFCPVYAEREFGEREARPMPT